MCCITSVPSFSQQLSLSSSPTCRAKSCLLLVSHLPWPSQHLPVRPRTTRSFVPCLHQIKHSCQAPYLNIWSSHSPLHVPSLTHLLSHEEIKLPVSTFKEFVSSPPTTYHPAESLLPPHPLISSSPAPLRGLRVGFSSLCCPACLAFSAVQCHTLAFLFIFNFLRRCVHLCQQTANPFGTSYKDFSESP